VKTASSQALTKELATLVRETVCFIDHNPAQRAPLSRKISATPACARPAPGGGGGGVPAAASAGGAPSSAPSGQPAAAARSGRQPPADGADPAMVQRLKQTGQVWGATIAKMTRNLDQIAKTVTTASKDHELGESFEKEFQAVVEPLVKTVDRQMSALLHCAAEAGSAEEHQRALTEVREAVGQLQTFAQSHPVIEHLDRNPFHPLAIANTLNASLAAAPNTLR
jgi:hypothetical protein